MLMWISLIASVSLSIALWRHLRRVSRSAHRLRAHHHQGSGAVRDRCRREHRCHHYRHHLLLNRNAIFVGGIRPHHFCLPVLKRETHREALVEVATSGSKKFFSVPTRRRTAQRQGGGLRLCRLLFRACRDRAVRGGVRGRGSARQAGGIRELQWPRFLSAATQHRHLDAGARCLERATDARLSCRRSSRSAAGGEQIAWRLA